ncbi:DUF397 domain-containing protein [Streptomyces sp. NPDC057474]|uniref:DUF397 domain-containing protein n=1 Tax=Streptomyces sp. NPDC057474 TaxID=3346144 RepID=UPI00368B05D0
MEAAYTWRKSSHSDGEGGQCVEISPCPHTIHIRDSKNPTGPHHLDLSPTAWTASSRPGKLVPCPHDQSRAAGRRRATRRPA